MRLALGIIFVCGVLATSAAASVVISFRTPSGNIGCVYSSGLGPGPSLRCDIRSGLSPRPGRPRGCQGEYGDSVSMNRTGRAHLVCHGDTALEPSARVVAYGTSITVGPFRCTSRTTGLTCTNASGHGWFLSRQSYRLF